MFFCNLPSGHDQELCMAGPHITAQALASGFRDAPAIIHAQTSRRKSKLRLRHLVIYISHVVFGLSQKAVARLFRRDRTTVRYICARVEDFRDDIRLDRMLNAFEAALAAFSNAFCPPAMEKRS